VRGIGRVLVLVAVAALPATHGGRTGEVNVRAGTHRRRRLTLTTDRRPLPNSLVKLGIEHQANRVRLTLSPPQISATFNESGMATIVDMRRLGADVFDSWMSVRGLIANDLSASAGCAVASTNIDAADTR